MMLLSLLLFASVAADVRTDLYVGEAPTESAAATGRAPIVEALNQVLVRLTGRVGEDPVSELGIDARAAEQLAIGRQFARKTVPQAGGELLEQRVLRVDFDPAALDDLLQRTGWPRWGGERPAMLLWIVEDRGLGVDYVTERPALQHAIDEAAFRYGMRITRPILDARDRLEVGPADVRGGFTSLSEPAVSRYGADGVIMLDLRRNPSFWTGRWAWRIGDEEVAFERSGADPAEVVGLGLARITESLAGRFAVRSEPSRARRLVVSGIETNAHFDEVSGFLEQLTGIESVRIAAASGHRLTFEIEVTTDRLRERIELTGPLAFERLDLGSNVLYYRFRL